MNSILNKLILTTMISVSTPWCMELEQKKEPVLLYQPTQFDTLKKFKNCWEKRDKLSIITDTVKACLTNFSQVPDTEQCPVQTEIIWFLGSTNVNKINFLNFMERERITSDSQVIHHFLQDAYQTQTNIINSRMNDIKQYSDFFKQYYEGEKNLQTFPDECKYMEHVKFFCSSRNGLGGFLLGENRSNKSEGSADNGSDSETKNSKMGPKYF